jgi:hypothetical protein
MKLVPSDVEDVGYDNWVNLTVMTENRREGGEKSRWLVQW